MEIPKLNNTVTEVRNSRGYYTKEKGGLMTSKASQ